MAASLNTARSRGSWASQVEEEEEFLQATNQTGATKGMRGSQLPSAERAADDAGKKNRKKKKKKSNSSSKGLSSSSAAEDCRPSSASVGQDVTERLSSLSIDEALNGSSVAVGGNHSFEGPVRSVAEVDGSNSAENVDRKGRVVETLSSSPGRRIGASTAVWAPKRSDSGNYSEENKAGGPNKFLPGSVWQPVGVVADAGLPSPSNESRGFGRDVPAVKHAGESSGGWVSHVQVCNDDSGWKVSSGSRRNQGEPTAMTVAGAAANLSTVSSADGNWDEQVAGEYTSNWDLGWEVASSRRGKKGDESSAKSIGGSNAGPRGKGGRGFQPNSGEYVQKVSAKQRSGEWEKASRGGRSPGNSLQDKVGRVTSPRDPPGFGAARQAPVVSSNWTKPLNESASNSSDWDAQSGHSTNCANNSGGSVNSASILGKLLPRVRSAPDSNPGIQIPNDASISIDAWKGGFPAFSGNGSSVFDDCPASLYSDSQCSDDDLDSDSMSLASFESENSHKSHSTQRMNKWFRSFFQELDVLTEEQLHEHDRQWHCPSCRGGVGAIDWYRGLQPLLAHAKTVRSKRVKLHKAFAEVLEEEIRIRGAAPGTHGSGKYGKWRGLGDENETRDVLWPPMVVVRNTQLEQDEDDKWIGMGNKELLDLFKKHNPVKARHAYGPQGHRGISVLIFAESPTGYYGAQLLETQFIEARRGRDNWDASGRLLFQPGGDRILYGYMATPDDLDIFNKHSKGKQNLKWELKSFQEMVLSPMRKLDEENNKVTILQGKVQREMEAKKALKKTVSIMSNKLIMREEELKVVRERARQQRKQQDLEMEDMEGLYKDRIQQLKQNERDQEKILEKKHEERQRDLMEQLECLKLELQTSRMSKDMHLSHEQQQQQALMEGNIAHKSLLVELCIKNQEQWQTRKLELLRERHQKMMEFKSRQWEDLIRFEETLEQEKIEIMESFKCPTEAQVEVSTLSDAWD